MATPSAPPAYDNPSCSEEIQLPGYPELERQHELDQLPILLPVTHPTNPLNIMLDTNWEQSSTSTEKKSSITVQPIGTITTKQDKFDGDAPETCCDHFKFWGCFTCLVCAYCCSMMK